MDSSKFYREITPYYDRIFPGDPAAAGFITRRAGTAGGLCVDVGCAGGTLALELAAAGFRVLGIDASSELITVAEKKAAGHPKAADVTFRVTDMMRLAETCPPGEASAVSCLGNTLVHLTDTTAMVAFFSQAAAVLEKGAPLVLQIINYDRILDHYIKELPTIETDDLRFERSYLRPLDGGCMTFRTRLTLKKTGEVLSNAVPLFPLRRGHLEQLLDEAGFGRVSCFADFEEHPVTDKSLALVVSAAV